MNADEHGSEIEAAGSIVHRSIGDHSCSSVATSPVLAPLPIPHAPLMCVSGCARTFRSSMRCRRSSRRPSGGCRRSSSRGRSPRGNVLIAEEVGSAEDGVRREDSESLYTPPFALRTPLGYLIGNDQYFKRDDVGIIYAINVVPSHQRSLVAATLLKAQFERSAVRVQALLLLVRAGPRGESVLGGDGVCAAGVQDGRDKRQGTCPSRPHPHFLAEAHPIC